MKSSSRIFSASLRLRKAGSCPALIGPNLKHHILTEDGFFQLGHDLEDSLLEVLAAIPDPEDEAESHGLPN